MPDVDDTATVHDNPFVHLSLERAIRLRWALRDILAKRTQFLPLADADQQLQIGIGQRQELRPLGENIA